MRRDFVIKKYRRVGTVRSTVLRSSDYRHTISLFCCSSSRADNDVIGKFWMEAGEMQQLFLVAAMFHFHQQSSPLRV